MELTPIFVPTKEQIFFFYEFQKCVNTSAAAKCIQFVYEVYALSDRICRRLFSRFKTGNFSLEDESKTVAQKESIQRIWNLLLQPIHAVRELSKDIFNISYTTVPPELKKIS